MSYKSTVMIPGWVRDLDISDCIPGLVYNIYKCRVCMLEHSADMLRKGRKYCRMINGVKSMKTKCACHKKKGFLLKLKICAYCGTLVYGYKISKGNCCNCSGNPKYVKIKPYNQDIIQTVIRELKPYYRMNKLIESYTSLEDPTRYNCCRKDTCLEITFKRGNYNIKLGCKECPEYLPFGV